MKVEKEKQSKKQTGYKTDRSQRSKKTFKNFKKEITRGFIF